MEIFSIVEAVVIYWNVSKKYQITAEDYTLCSNDVTRYVRRGTSCYLRASGEHPLDVNTCNRQILLVHIVSIRIDYG